MRLQLLVPLVIYVARIPVGLNCLVLGTVSVALMHFEHHRSDKRTSASSGPVWLSVKTCPVSDLQREGFGLCELVLRIS